MAKLCWTHALWILVLAPVLSGCASRQTGYRISNETIAFIHPGTTTRSDIIENLGPPLLELKDPHVAAYSWGKMRATATSTAAREDALQNRQMGYGMAPPTEEGTMIESRRWVCCIALDANDRVTRVGRIEIEGAGSLETAVRQWANSP